MGCLRDQTISMYKCKYVTRLLKNTHKHENDSACGVDTPVYDN